RSKFRNIRNRNCPAGRRLPKLSPRTFFKPGHRYYFLIIQLRFFIMNILYKLFSVAALCAVVGTGCTKLDEESFGSLSPDTYYKNEQEALSSVVGVYQLLSYNADIGDPWRMKEFSTDEFIVPGRA